MAVQKANVTVLVLIVAAVAAILVAEWYYFDYRPRQAEAVLNAGTAGAPLPEHSNLAGDPDVSAETSGGREGDIIECKTPELGTFYTNADSCEEGAEELAENGSLLREE